MKYGFIAEHAQVYPVARQCAVLEVSVSGYYSWLKRQPSARERSDRVLLEQITQVHQHSRGLYGSPRVHAALKQEGVLCSRKRVARLMRQAGLRSLRVVGRRIHSTDSQHSRPVAPNLLQRDFTATAPNQKWLGDIMGIWTHQGWLYLAALLDTYSRLVVGWAMSVRRDEALVTAALRMALGRRLLTHRLIHHTDQGSQYAAAEYRDLLAADGITVSMSRKGDCYDNAMMESFFSTLRTECTQRQPYPTRAEARTSLFEFIEVFYNRQRLHSSLAHCTPLAYEVAYCHRFS